MSDRGLAYKSIDQIKTSESAPVSGDFTVFYDASEREWVKQSPIDRAPVALDATDAMTVAEHANRVLYCTTAATLTWTLPAATGTGNYYMFLLGILTTGDKVITCSELTNHRMIGSIIIADGDTPFLPDGFQPGASDETVTMNKTTTGGMLGDWVKVTDVATNKWFVEGVLHSATGSDPATPFSNAS